MRDYSQARDNKGTSGEAMFCFRLPYLLPVAPGGANRPEDEFSGLRHLWPGAGELSGSPWTPPNLPLAPAEAEAIVREMRSLGLAELERMRLLAPQKAMEPEVRLRREWESLAGFMRECGSAPTERRGVLPATDLLLCQAQTRLLWQMVLEENIREIAGLASRCAAAEKNVAACLHEVPDEDFSGNENMGADTSLMPAWQASLASALFFLPADAPIFMEGAMRDELEDILPFQPAPQYAHLLGCPSGRESGIWRAVAPIGALPGFSFYPDDSDFVKNLYDYKRTWLIWRHI